MNSGHQWDNQNAMTKVKIETKIRSIDRTPDGNFHIDQEITSVRRDTMEELKELIIPPKHWTIPIKRSRKEPLTKEEIDWRHKQAKEKSPRKEKKKPPKKK